MRSGSASIAGQRIKRQRIRHNKSDFVQRYMCLSCKKMFSANFGFRYRRYSPEIVSEALHPYFSGMPARMVGEVNCF